MAKKTTRSKTRKKTGTATPKLDAARLFGEQYPLAQLAEAWVQQLEDRLETATEDDSTAVSAELALERRAQETFQKMDALTGELRAVMTASPADKAGEEERDRRVQALREELNSTSGQLQLEAKEGSALACYALGSTVQRALGRGEKVDTKRLQAARDNFAFAAERGFTPAFCDLSECCAALGDREAAEQWFARALKAKEPPALLEEARILINLQPLPAEELQTRLDSLYELALRHCWDALALLAIVCKQRRENETVQAFAPKPLLLLQGLARQGFTPAMCALGNYYDTVLLAPDFTLKRDKRVHSWYDMAASRGDLNGLISSLRAGFCGAAYTGSAPTAVARITATKPADPRDEAELKRLLGRLLRQPGMPEGSLQKSDDLLFEAAEKGNSHDLCAAIRSEIVWDDDATEQGYPANTPLNDKRLDKDPRVRFTRGQTMLNFPGQMGAAFRQRALNSIMTVAEQGDTEAICWLADASLRGLYGVKQNIRAGLESLQAGLVARHPRAMALEAIRQLGWIKGIPGRDNVDRAWMRELLGMSASADDCLGYAALVLLEALEPAPLKRQKELGVHLAKAIMWARMLGDASALFLLGCVGSLHMEDPNLNTVCKLYDTYLCQTTGSVMGTGDFAAAMACSTFHSAGLLGEPKGEPLSDLVDPEGDLPKTRAAGTDLEQFM